MKSSAFHKILKKVRTILAEMPWKRILTFSFFIVLSASFWFMQVYRKSFHATYHVPVKYVSIPDSIVFEDDLPANIDVTIEDTGYALFKYFFTKSNDSLHIDIADIIKYSSTKVLQGSMFEQIIKDQLLASSSVLAYNPSRISFDYTILQQKKIPVILDGQIFLAQGYLLSGDIYTIPDSVMAYGGKDVLASLNYAYTVNDTINNIKTQEPLEFDIKPIHNVKFNPNKVKIVVPVDKYTQKVVTIPITCINLPEELSVKFFPSNIKISFLVGLSQYNSITEDDFSIQLDYNDLKDIRDLVSPLRITSSPDHVKNLTLSPSEVEFIFEQK